MIKLKNILLEIASPDIVVGFIDTDLNVVSANNISSHLDLVAKYPNWHPHSNIHWRYNASTMTVYWYQLPDDKQRDAVKEEIVRKYKYFHVLYNVYIRNRGWSGEYMKLQAKAHGIS